MKIKIIEIIKNELPKSKGKMGKEENAGKRPVSTLPEF
jgi:hypothetical protein